MISEGHQESGADEQRELADDGGGIFGIAHDRNEEPPYKRKRLTATAASRSSAWLKVDGANY
jgi:hypothetical protein